MKPKCLTNSMAQISYSSSSASSRDYEKLDLESIPVLFVSINKYIHEFIMNPESRNVLRLRSTSKLKIEKQEFFEFSEHSVISNLFWGIEGIEAAIQAKQSEEKTARLRSCEKMLQIPALLDEHGVTVGIPNRYLVCYSYFYLSVVRKLQRDELQVVLHFLQALLVFPMLVWRQIAPTLCESLFPLCNVSENEEKVGDTIRQMARRYKDYLMYYQVMLYGETPQWHCNGREIPLPDDYLRYSLYEENASIEFSSSTDEFEKVRPLDPTEIVTDNMTDEATASRDIPEFRSHKKANTELNQVCSTNIERSSDIKCLQDMLREYQSDTPISVESHDDSNSEDDDLEASVDYAEDFMRTVRIIADDPQPEMCYQKQQDPYSISNLDPTAVSLPRELGHLMHEEANDVDMTKLFPGKIQSPNIDSNLSITELRDNKSCTSCNCHVQVASQHSIHPQTLRIFNHMSFTSHRDRFTNPACEGSATRGKQATGIHKIVDEMCSIPEKYSNSELVGKLEKAISKLCFSGPAKCDEDYSLELTAVYETLNNKIGAKYSLLKNVILDILLAGISTSKEEGMIRASVSILTTIVSGNKSAIEDIKRKGLRLCDLTNALKRNVHEAAVLIYLIHPSPREIKTLEVLPILVEIVCTSDNYKGGPSLQPTPPAASLMIIKTLVTAFDYATNSKHLDAISRPGVLSSLLDVAKNNNQEAFIAFATILVQCIRHDGSSRKYVSQSTPVAPFICLLTSNKKRAKLIALEFFHEILCMPRTSNIALLQRIQREGGINIMYTLMPYLQQPQNDHQLLAANLLLQLDMMEDSAGEIIFTEEAMKVILDSVTSKECAARQQLSAFILSNLGGTYAWTGEPYTVAWLVKRAGLTSLQHRNIIKNIDWMDQSLQDAGTELWCSKVARTLIKLGNPLFHALEKGLNSKIKRISRDCLTTITWLGYEIAKSPNSIRHSACDILLTGIMQFLHPGFDLEERLLACLCIYNYASGKGMQKLTNFSEGVRESLRRLSDITWMAEELLKVADYFLPNKSRISCVHTQILEAGDSSSGAVSALIYYKGQLYSGYSDGSIKVWDIKGQSATLVMDMKEHKKAVTCFSLFEPGDSLLSGSADKTIRVWQMNQKKLNCTEVIAMKEPIRSLDTCAKLIIVITQSHCMKLIDASRTFRDIWKSKNVRCVSVVQGKIYVGCKDSSVQELTITNNRKREIKAPFKSWLMQSRPVNSIVVYKDWLYSASVAVEGSNLKEWRRLGKPQILIASGKGAKLVAMAVVEDFIYLTCSSAKNNLQICLRGSQQKVGRLSAGSRITSLLTANDIVICGTKSGLIKGWIPL